MIRPRSPLELAESQHLAKCASLAGAILVTLRRPGRGVAESERQLRSWLQADGVEFGNDNLTPALERADIDVDEAALDDMLVRLHDCKQVTVWQPQSTYPRRYVPSGRAPFNETDFLMSEVGRVMRSRSEAGYRDLDHLKSWLIEANVDFTDAQLVTAVSDLEWFGRLATPSQDRWEKDGPRGEPQERLTMWFEPRPYRGS